MSLVMLNCRLFSPTLGEKRARTRSSSVNASSTLSSPNISEMSSPLSSLKVAGITSPKLECRRTILEIPDFDPLYREKFVVRYYEMGGKEYKISISTIANMLQEVTVNHVMGQAPHGRNANSNKSTFVSILLKERLMWVMSRLHIQVHKYPLWGDEVEISTWMEAQSMVRTKRDWVFTDPQNGTIFATATSTWTMMDRDTRRLAKKTICFKQPFLRPACLPEAPAFPHISLPEEYDFVRNYLQANYEDFNEHVNNVAYIKWMLESVRTLPESYELASVSVAFKSECRTGHPVVARAARNRTGGSQELEMIHTVESEGDGKELARGRTVWRKKTSGLID